MAENNNKKLEKSKQVTIKDIANRCNVSLATVSRVLSNSDYPVNKTTKENILNVARELKYVPNTFAQNLKSTSLSHEVAVIVPSISNPFYASLITGFESVLIKAGYSVIIYNSNSVNSENYDTIIKSIAGKRVRGVLITSANMDNEVIKNVISGGFGDTKIVFADCTAPQNNINSVCFDYKKGTYIGTNYLINKGHRNIVYAGMKLDRESRKLRLEGFNNALAENGIVASDTENVVLIDEKKEYGLDSDNRQIQIGEKLADKILKLPKLPTAVVAINDMVAFGIISRFKKNGINVPNDISVLGFDDNIFCEAYSPSLTTIKVQDEQIGRMAGMLLVDDMNGVGPSNNINLFLEPSIIERETVKDLNM